MIEESSSSLFEENCSFCVKILSISPSISILELIRFLDSDILQSLNDRITHFYIIRAEKHVHLYLRVDNQNSVKFLLNKRRISFKDSAMIVKAVVKPKPKKQKENKQKLQLQQIENKFGMNTIEQILKSSDALDTIAKMYQTMIYKGPIMSLDREKLREQIRTQYRDFTCEEELDPLLSVDTKATLFRKLIVISCLLMIEEFPYHNSESLMKEYDELASHIRHDISEMQTQRRQYISQCLALRYRFLPDTRDLSSTLSQILETSSPSVSFLQLRSDLLQSIRDACSQNDILCGYVPYLYGSSATDFITDNCDFDVAMLPANEMSYCDLPCSEKLELMKELLLSSAGFDDAHVRPPVLKIVYQHTDVDICFDHKLNVVNTQLLQQYATIEPLVVDLVKLVKQWAKVHDLNDCPQGGLPSYAFSLMCIFYMQRTNLLPNLQHLLSREDVKPTCIANADGFVQGFDCRYICDNQFIRKVWKPAHEDLDILTLFIGFFQFYSNFNFARYSICIRNNELIEKTPRSPEKERLSLDINVVDPFDFRELARFCSSSKLLSTQSLIQDTYRALVSGDYSNIFAHSIMSEDAVFEIEPITGKLIVDCLDSSNVSICIDGSVLQLKREDVHYVAHGDMITYDGRFIQQLNPRCQEIVGLCTVSKTNQALIPIDTRYQEIFCAQRHLFGLEMESYGNCQLIMQAKRMYPWKYDRMKAMPHCIIGGSLDIHAQRRSIIMANFTNNQYPSTLHPVMKSESQLYRLSFPLFNAMTLLFAFDTFDEQRRLKLYVPDLTDMSNKRFVQVCVHSHQLSVSSCHVELPQQALDNSIEFTEEVCLFSSINDLIRSTKELYYLFEYDMDMLPINLIPSEPSCSSSLYQNMLVLLENGLKSCSDFCFGVNLVKQYVKTVNQLYQVDTAFYCMYTRTIFRAQVIGLHLTGELFITLQIKELNLIVSLSNLLNLSHVMRETESQVLHFTFNDGTNFNLELGDQVNVTLMVDTLQSTPSVIPTSIELCV